MSCLLSCTMALQTSEQLSGHPPPSSLFKAFFIPWRPASSSSLMLRPSRQPRGDRSNLWGGPFPADPSQESPSDMQPVQSRGWIKKLIPRETSDTSCYWALTLGQPALLCILFHTEPSRNWGDSHFYPVAPLHRCRNRLAEVKGPVQGESRLEGAVWVRDVCLQSPGGLLFFRLPAWHLHPGDGPHWTWTTLGFGG